MDSKTIVISGSTRGIGHGLAKEFLKLGHQVVINGRAEEKVQEIVEEFSKISSAVIGVAGDAALEKTHQELLKNAIDKFGKIDIWINNAGVPQMHEKFVKLETNQIQQLINVNITGSLIGTKVAANFMIDQGFGKIFNMEGFGSDGRIMDKLSLYGTTKRSINYFSKSVAKELSESPVHLGVIQPGMVRTDFIRTSMDNASAEEKKQFKKVYDILAEDVEVVTKKLAPRILSNAKNYDRIEFLSKFKLMGKIFKLMIS